MIKVAALTSGRNVPSTRFRIRQYIQPLREFGIEVQEFCPSIDKHAPIPGWPSHLRQRYILSILPIYAAWQGVKIATRIPGVLGSYRKEITWLGRQLLPGYLTFEPLMKKPILFDVDDAIWLGGPFAKSSVVATARRAEVVVAGNEYIANWFDKFSKNVRVVPTCVDTDKFQPNMHNSFDTDAFVIGWIGTKATLPYLESIETPLHQFVSKIPEARVLVVADTSPSFKQIPLEKVSYIPWSKKIEAKAIQKMDVGLMPLPDTEWTKGKCAFKMLQYMACGIPVVVSPVRTNAKVLGLGDVGISAQNNAEWYEALDYLQKNRNTARNMGKNGRVVVKRHFDRKLASKQIAEIILSLE